MSARKAKHRPQTPKARHARHRLSNTDIEDLRLALLGVVATCEVVRASYAATRSVGIVLTRGALQPLRNVLELLGDEDADDIVIDGPGART
jgi:hypothetical protein